MNATILNTQNFVEGSQVKITNVSYARQLIVEATAYYELSALTKKKMAAVLLHAINKGNFLLSQAVRNVYYLYVEKVYLVEEAVPDARENAMKFVEAMILVYRSKGHITANGKQLQVTNKGIASLKNLIKSIQQDEAATKEQSVLKEAATAPVVKELTDDMVIPAYATLETVEVMNDIDIVDFKGQLTFNLDQLPQVTLNVITLPKVDNQYLETSKVSEQSHSDIMAQLLGGQVSTATQEPQEDTVSLGINLDDFDEIKEEAKLMNFNGTSFLDEVKEGIRSNSITEVKVSTFDDAAIKDSHVTSALTEQQFKTGFTTFGGEFYNVINEQQVVELSNGANGTLFKDVLAFAIQHDYVIKQDLLGMGLYTYSLSDEGKSLLDIQ